LPLLKFQPSYETPRWL